MDKARGEDNTAFGPECSLRRPFPAPIMWDREIYGGQTVKKAILAALAACLWWSGASAETMTLAERRAQLVALSERGLAAPAQGAAAASRRDLSNEEPGTIVIETGRRVLHYVSGEGETLTFPIAVGREGAQWTGTTSVVGKKVNPEWRPTPNMRRKNPSLPAVVAPGPKNPLGVRAIYLAQGYLRIHGTNDPSSIGKAVSSGCFRMRNEDVKALYPLVSSGAKVVIVR